MGKRVQRLFVLGWLAPCINTQQGVFVVGMLAFQRGVFPDGKVRQGNRPSLRAFRWCTKVESAPVHSADSRCQGVKLRCPRRYRELEQPRVHQCTPETPSRKRILRRAREVHRLQPSGECTSALAGKTNTTTQTRTSAPVHLASNPALQKVECTSAPEGDECTGALHGRENRIVVHLCFPIGKVVLLKVQVSTVDSAFRVMIQGAGQAA